MSITHSLREASKWLFVPLGILLAIALIVSIKKAPDITEQLRAECRAKYAEARTRDDSIIVDNWIPAAGLQPTRAQRHCKHLVSRPTNGLGNSVDVGLD